MKKLTKFILGGLILSLLLVLGYQCRDKVMGAFTTRTSDSGITVENYNAGENYNSDDKPVIVGQSALTLDVDSNKIIYEKNVHNRMYPASTTKLLTAMVLADSMAKNDRIVYTRDAEQQPESKIGLEVGETLTADEAMNAMLIYSANDIAEAIGENVSSDIAEFAGKMNQKAAELGLKESHFENANGLHNENHYTTAYDLSLIAKNVYKYPSIMSAISKKSYNLRLEKGDINIVNTNKLLGIDGCVAGKTGYTSEAGRCLVAYFERNNKKMIGIVMASADDNTLYNDMEKIINWSYNR